MPHHAPYAPRPVILRPEPAEAEVRLLTEVALRVRGLAGGDVADAVTWATEVAPHAPDPGSGATALRWELMATVASQDLTVARVVEPHLDAHAILHEAGEAIASGRSWGVYAAEGPAPRLEAAPAAAPDGWMLTGRKPWCSLADRVSHALVTAWVGSAGRSLFAVDLGHEGVVPEGGPWVPRGLVGVTSTALLMDGVPAREVGGPGWYLDRPGFAWGGIGVAAVWYGGAVGLARRLAAEARRREPDQVALMHLGTVDAALAGARAVLHEAAHAVDAGRTTGDAAALLAARVRHVVSTAAETVLTEVAHGLGPGPLAQEADHAARVADLELYLRQHHAARDAVASGRMLVGRAGEPW